MKNIKAYPCVDDGAGPSYLICYGYENWYYGYTCRFPSITFDNIRYYDRRTGEPMPCGYEVKLIDEKRSIGSEPAIRLDKTLRTHPFNIDYTGKMRAGIEDVYSYQNLNKVVPPEAIKMLGNTVGYTYLVPNTYALAGLGADGFFENTKFYYSDTEYYEGTNHTGKDTETFKFVTLDEA